MICILSETGPISNIISTELWNLQMYRSLCLCHGYLTLYIFLVIPLVDLILGTVFFFSFQENYMTSGARVSKYLFTLSSIRYRFHFKFVSYWYKILKYSYFWWEEDILRRIMTCCFIHTCIDFDGRKVTKNQYLRIQVCENKWYIIRRYHTRKTIIKHTGKRYSSSLWSTSSQLYH